MASPNTKDTDITDKLDRYHYASAYNGEWWWRGDLQGTFNSEEEPNSFIEVVIEGWHRGQKGEVA